MYFSLASIHQIIGFFSFKLDKVNTTTINEADFTKKYKKIVFTRKMNKLRSVYVFRRKQNYTLNKKYHMKKLYKK